MNTIQKHMLSLVGVVIANHAMQNSFLQERAEGIKEYHQFREFAPKELGEFLDNIKMHHLPLLAHVSSNLYECVARYIEFLHHCNPNITDQTIKQLSLPDRLIVKWAALGHHFNMVPYYSGSHRYFYFDQNEPNTTALKGKGRSIDYGQIFADNLEANKRCRAFESLVADMEKRRALLENVDSSHYIDEEELLDLENAKAEARRVCTKYRGMYALALQERVQKGMDLEQQYYINLMPGSDLTSIIIKMLRAIKNDSDLANNIQCFKALVDSDLTFSDYDTGSRCVPRISILPAQGKNSAQLVLNKLYTLFKHTKGLNAKPDYTAMVTDLIGVSQGDFDFRPFGYDYFERGLVYYKNLTGTNVDYHLLHPETGQEIL